MSTPPESQRTLTMPAALAVTAAVLALYLATMPPGVVFEDSGLFAAVCYTAGIAHPPGYPLHTLLCVPFAQLADILPISPATAAALASVVPAAIAAALLARILARISGSAHAGAAVALMWAFAPIVWKNSTIPEVYALNALLIAVLWALAQSYLHRPRAALIVAGFFVAGLGLANHWPLLILTGPAFLLMLMPKRRELMSQLSKPRVLAACAGALALGLTPYLYLPLRAADPGVFSIFPPPDSWDAFWGHVTREAYAGRAEESFLSERLIRASTELGIFWSQLAAVGAFIVPFGLVLIWRRGEHWLAIACLWGCLASTSMLAFILGGIGADLTLAVFSVYPIPAVMFATPPIAVAAVWLLRRFPAAGGWPAFVLPALALVWSYPQGQRADDRLAEDFTAALFDSLPQGASLSLAGDFSFPAIYRTRTLGERQDLDLFKTDGSGIIDAEEVVERAAKGGVFMVDPPVEALQPYGLRFNGFAYEMDPSLDQNTYEVELSPESLQMLQHLLELSERGVSDGWNRHFINRRLRDWGRMLTHLKHADPQRMEEGSRLDELRQTVVATPMGAIGEFYIRAISGVAPYKSWSEFDLALKRMDWQHLSRNPARLATVLQAIAAAALARGREPEIAIQALEDAVERYPRKDNLAIIDLLQVYASVGRWDDYRELRFKFPALGEVPALAKFDRICKRRYLHKGGCEIE